MNDNIWMPIREVAAQKFFFGVEEHISVAKMCWGIELNSEEVWEFAQKIFSEINNEIPGQLTEQDLEYYHPTNKR